MTAINVEIIDAQLRAKLALAIANNRNLRPLTAALAADLHGGVEDVLEAEGMPKWRGLGPVQTARRIKGGTWPGKLLQVTGQLAASIQPDNGDDFAQVSTNLKKAKTLNFGAQQGEFGRSKRGGPIPWGDIEPRPFMVIPPYVKDTMVKRTLSWVSGSE